MAFNIFGEKLEAKQNAIADLGIGEISVDIRQSNAGGIVGEPKWPICGNLDPERRHFSPTSRVLPNECFNNAGTTRPSISNVP